MAAVCFLGLGTNELQAGTNAPDPSDPILNLFLQKGFITQSEADKARAEVQAMRTNELSELPSQLPPSKWKLDNGIKNIQFFGDIRLRYEDRSSQDPTGGKIDLQRFRYALRFGFRGDALDNSYYGFRLETASNPRSPWVTFGTSSSGYPYQGPFGKSTASLNIGQIYLGWRPRSWFDVTIGKMPNPLFTTPMVSGFRLEPGRPVRALPIHRGRSGLFCRFRPVSLCRPKSIVRLRRFGRFIRIYGNGQSAENNLFMITWSGGLIYHITTNITAKVGANVYQYYRRPTEHNRWRDFSYFGDTYVGEGAYTGPGSQNPYNGFSGYGTSGSLPGNESRRLPQ